MEENNTNPNLQQISGDALNLEKRNSVSSPKEDKQEEVETLPEHQNQGDFASSSAFANKGNQRDNDEETEQANVKSDALNLDKNSVPPPGEDNQEEAKTLPEHKNQGDSASSPEFAIKESQSDSGRETGRAKVKNDILAATTEPPPHEESPSGLKEREGKGPDVDVTESEKDESNDMLHEQRHKVEVIGPVSDGKTWFEIVAEFIKENGIYILGLVIAVVAVLLMTLPLHQPEPLLEVTSVDRLLGQMDKLKTRFPHQRAELWSRSKIHLKKHLQTTQPTAPVNLILTAGVQAKTTLHCLAQGLASAYSLAVNASTLNIDGASAASQDSDQVKLDIDSKLQGAFGGDKPVAVIHRFEELPPGSTLIFYRYCDHENAAFKDTVLIFTVLLEDDDIPGKVHLNYVEEMVDDHLKKKFLTSSLPVSYDRMDLDKYSGLWSRISHLILPVAAETGIEHQGC